MLDQKIKKHMKVVMKNVCVKLQWKTYKKQKHFFLNTGIADLDKWEKTYFKNWSMHSPFKKFAENNYILRKCKIRCKNGHSHTDGRVWRNAPVKINSWHQKLQWGWIKYWKAPNLQDCRKNFNNSEQDTFGILPSLRRLSESIPKIYNKN